MDEVDVFAPLQDFILRLDERQAAANVRIMALSKALVGAEDGGVDPGDLERRRAELADATAEQAKLIEAMRWGWRLDGFLRGTRGSVLPRDALRALEAARASPSTPTPPPRGKPNSKTSRACECISTALREHGRLHRQRLLEILVAEGVLGTEARPINRLATILAENRHLFGSDGRGTYFLLPSERTEQRPGATWAGTPPEGRPLPPHARLEGRDHAVG